MNREVWADYDQCLRIESPDNDNDLPKIRGQFCHLDLPQTIPNWKDYRKNTINETLIERINFHLANMERQNISVPQKYQHLTKFEFNKQLVEDVIRANDFIKPFAKLPVTLCLPTTCSTKDIENTINKGLNQKLFSVFRYFL